MKKLLVTVAILLPQFAMLPLWYMRSNMSIFELSAGLPTCQLLYNGLIGPFLIGIYGGWEIIQKNESAWKVLMLCLLLTILVEFTGYANWGLSTGLFWEPDNETVLLQFIASVVAVIIIGLLLIPSFAVRGLDRLFSRKRKQKMLQCAKRGSANDPNL
jgi:hypothetical protein